MKYFIICNKLNGPIKWNSLIYLKVINMNYIDYIFNYDYIFKNVVDIFEVLFQMDIEELFWVPQRNFQ